MSEMILFSTVNIFHLELESIGRRFVAKKNINTTTYYCKTKRLSFSLIKFIYLLVERGHIPKVSFLKKTHKEIRNSDGKEQLLKWFINKFCDSAPHFNSSGVIPSKWQIRRWSKITNCFFMVYDDRYKTKVAKWAGKFHFYSIREYSTNSNVPPFLS